MRSNPCIIVGKRSKSRSYLHDKAFERRSRSDCVHEQVAKWIANVRFTLGPAKHEKVAIYVVNQRISNVCRIAGAASQRSNSQASIGVKTYFVRHLKARLVRVHI